MKTDRRLSATALAFPFFFFQTAYSDGGSVAVEVFFFFFKWGEKKRTAGRGGADAELDATLHRKT